MYYLPPMWSTTMSDCESLAMYKLSIQGSWWLKIKWGRSRGTHILWARFCSPWDITRDKTSIRQLSSLASVERTATFSLQIHCGNLAWATSTNNCTKIILSFGKLVVYEIETSKSDVLSRDNQYYYLRFKDTSYAWGPKMTPLLHFIRYLH